ncbi:MAG: Crossover junction endodeoxyribonuclease RuvC [Syntrophorhabdaceae bacterium PtaU1.Bin034]|jgi:crossover junction endodeoxyribonuclease RuvC|nr:MAG: Crossover junction endodeoxyribonuclease RuvC [Syntrophorhabdaceae bacterium PtaU1.Bin034]
MIILGIDPGLASTGFGAIVCNQMSPSLWKCGSIRTSARDHVSQRLFQIYNDLGVLMDEVKPEVVAVENIFSMVRYPKAGMMLGGVVAIIYLAAFQHGTKVIEVAPREVKNALAAHGAATKVQIRGVTKRVLGASGLKSFHAADALAVALTVFYRSYRGRNDFVPGRNT